MYISLPWNSFPQVGEVARMEAVLSSCPAPGFESCRNGISLFSTAVWESCRVSFKGDFIESRRSKSRRTGSWLSESRRSLFDDRNMSAFALALLSLFKMADGRILWLLAKESLLLSNAGLELPIGLNDQDRLESTYSIRFFQYTFIIWFIFNELTSRRSW